MALTDTWLKAQLNKDRDKAIVQSDRDGLGARVSPRGKITFQMRYRYAGSAKRVDVGCYPEVSLKWARAECLRLRSELELGHDPKVVQLLAKQERLGAETVEGMVRHWYESSAVKNKVNHGEIIRSFEIHVFPVLGELPAASVTVSLWLSVLEPLSKTTPGIAERLLVNAKQALNWAVRRDMLPGNALASINAKADLNIEKKVGSRSLDDLELQYFWEAVDSSRMAYKNKIFLKLCLHFGCRNGELRLAERDHFDFDAGVWTVPAENHKTGRRTGKPLLRPIIDEVRPMIDEALALSGSNRYLFTNANNTKPMGVGAPLALPYNVMQWLRRHRGYEMVHWSVHDLRKTARTNWSTMGPPHVAEIMLGHRLPGEWQTYDRHDYLEEQADIYRQWWKRLQSVVIA